MGPYFCLSDSGQCRGLKRHDRGQCRAGRPWAQTSDDRTTATRSLVYFPVDGRHSNPKASTLTFNPNPNPNVAKNQIVKKKANPNPNPCQNPLVTL